MRSHHFHCEKTSNENVLPFVFYGLILVGCTQFVDASLKMSCRVLRVIERTEMSRGINPNIMQNEDSMILNHDLQCF